MKNSTIIELREEITKFEEMSMHCGENNCTKFRRVFQNFLGFLKEFRVKSGEFV